VTAEPEHKLPKQPLPPPPPMPEIGLPEVTTSNRFFEWLAQLFEPREKRR
jgi:hypothetical protein